jgi:hypothetical protein
MGYYTINAWQNDMQSVIVDDDNGYLHFTRAKLYIFCEISKDFTLFLIELSGKLI